MRQLHGERLAEAILEWNAGIRKYAPQGTPIDIYMDHFTRKGEGCWQWTGGTCHGYGKFRLGGKYHYAHRVAYELSFGTPGSGLCIDHKCRNRACVRPDHLQAVTQQENNQNHDNASYGATGVRGVSHGKRDGTFIAYAMSNNVKYSAGTFESLGEAANAARELRMRLHTNNLADFEAHPGSAMYEQRELRRVVADSTEPPAPGEWQIDPDDHVGEDE